MCNSQASDHSLRINQLPAEILARIFLLGEDMQRSARLTSHKYVGLQDQAVQICRHWREIAIQTSNLWTYIFIAHPPPHESARLYLSRSGACPIHIDLNLGTFYINGISRFEEKTQVPRLKQTLGFLIANGGEVKRWRSLIVFTESPAMLFTTTDIICAMVASTLRFVSARWKMPPRYRAQERAFNDVFSVIRPYHPRCPQLNSMELHSLPRSLVFDCIRPLLANLQHLRLVCANVLYPIEGISAVLSACPRLQSLGLGMGLAEGDAETVVIAPLRVSLASLRILSLRLSTSCLWGLRLLQIIDIFQLETLQIQNYADCPDIPRLAGFIVAGRLNGVLQEDVISEDCSGAGPIFPYLSNLQFQVMQTTPTLNEAVLRAHPSVTYATLNLDSLILLGSSIELLPKMTHLKYVGLRTQFSLDTLRDVLAKRADAGMRLLLLEVPSNYHVLGDQNPDQTAENFVCLLDGLVDQVRICNDTECDTMDEEPMVTE